LLFRRIADGDDFSQPQGASAVGLAPGRCVDQSQFGILTADAPEPLAVGVANGADFDSR